MPATKTKKKTAQTTVHIGFVIDESGSMGGTELSIVTGFNEFVGALRGEQTEDAVRVFLAMFDATGGEKRVRVKFDGVPLDQVRELSLADYHPRGGTPLNDAISTGIGKLNAGMVKGDRGLLVIMTDGHENASELSTEDLRKLVEKTEADGQVEFIYLGANVDSFSESCKIGLSGKAGQAVNFSSSPIGTTNAVAGASMRAAAYASPGGKATYDVQSLSTPHTFAEDPEVFTKQQKEMRDAREKAEAETREKAAKDVESAAAQASKILRGE